ncbi:hypothetical protein LJC68_02745 [Bacteroidales bacterium OttesenSCG-928-B11]|nr:hypothetical protein [Bacteroidales bacterium OttesenSCG-928-C03]MDL2311781.1 hypothetical protein [Bacteroidales bacterium OttesenSCG-928-B11]
MKPKNGFRFLLFLVCVLLLTLPFHYIPSALIVIPKEHLSFNYTFITQNDVDELLRRYNNASTIFEQQTISQEPLMRRLVAKGIIYSSKDDDYNNSSADNSNTSNVPGTSSPQSSYTPENKYDESKNISKIPETTPDLEAIQDELAPLVETWNQAHSINNTYLFNRVFDDEILFYGSELKKDECIAKKRSLLSKHTDFEQIIIGKIEVEEYKPYQYKCSFVKRVTTGGKSTDYPSYLIFREYGDTWRAIAESDVITDRNLAKKR